MIRVLGKPEVRQYSQIWVPISSFRRLHENNLICLITYESQIFQNLVSHEIQLFHCIPETGRELSKLPEAFLSSQFCYDVLVFIKKKISFIFWSELRVFYFTHTRNLEFGFLKFVFASKCFLSVIFEIDQLKWNTINLYLLLIVQLR